MITNIILAGVVVVLAVLIIRQRRQVIGICRSALGQTFHKQKNKEKILQLLAERGELSNSDIRTVLEVSERSTVRYMDDLEKAGRVEQVGETGRDVVYRLRR